MHLATVLPWCLLKVRLCSPLQLVTLLYRCVFRLPPTPSSSTSQNPSCTNLFGKLLCTYFYDIFSDTDYVQNPSKKYICLKKLLGVLRGGVGWGLGTLFARQGDIRKERVSPNETRGLVIRRELCFFNIEVVTNVEWSSTTSRWWTSSSTSRWWTRCSCSPRSGSQAFRAFVRRQLLFFTASNKDQDQSFVNI